MMPVPPHFPIPSLDLSSTFESQRSREQSGAAPEGHVDALIARLAQAAIQHLLFAKGQVSEPIALLQAKAVREIALGSQKESAFPRPHIRKRAKLLDAVSELSVHLHDAVRSLSDIARDKDSGNACCYSNVAGCGSACAHAGPSGNGSAIVDAETFTSITSRTKEEPSAPSCTRPGAQDIHFSLVLGTSPLMPRELFLLSLRNALPHPKLASETLGVESDSDKPIVTADLSDKARAKLQAQLERKLVRFMVADERLEEAFRRNVAPTKTHIFLLAPRSFSCPGWTPRQNVRIDLAGLQPGPDEDADDSEMDSVDEFASSVHAASGDQATRAQEHTMERVGINHGALWAPTATLANPFMSPAPPRKLKRPVPSRSHVSFSSSPTFNPIADLQARAAAPPTLPSPPPSHSSDMSMTSSNSGEGLDDPEEITRLAAALSPQKWSQPLTLSFARTPRTPRTPGQREKFVNGRPRAASTPQPRAALGLRQIPAQIGKEEQMTARENANEHELCMGRDARQELKIPCDERETHIADVPSPNGHASPFSGLLPTSAPAFVSTFDSKSSSSPLSTATPADIRLREEQAVPTRRMRSPPPGSLLSRNRMDPSRKARPVLRPLGASKGRINGEVQNRAALPVYRGVNKERAPPLASGLALEMGTGTEEDGGEMEKGGGRAAVDADSDKIDNEDEWIWFQCETVLPGFS